MNIHEEDEIKKEFQLERIIFFSDAVFAIVITIMVLDVKLPEVERYSSNAEAKVAFLRVLPKIIPYSLSFFFIGGFWMRHLRIFSFLKDYNKPLLVINLLFLFCISLFPFAQSFLFGSSQIMNYLWGIYIYAGILYLTLFTQTLLIGYIIKNKDVLCTKTSEIETALKWKIKRLHYFSFPSIIILMICSSYLNFSPYVVYGAMVAYAVLIRRLTKIYYPRSPDERSAFIAMFSRSKLAKRTPTKIHK
jgi:uncharacterized membrane protein